MTDLTLGVTESSRHGAPMTMVRGGEERDLAAMVAMGRVRAEHVRFHLDRDIDLIQYAITTKRLLAGLGSANARQLHFSRRRHHRRSLCDRERRWRHVDARGMRATATRLAHASALFCKH